MQLEENPDLVTENNRNSPCFLFLLTVEQYPCSLTGHFGLIISAADDTMSKISVICYWVCHELLL